MILLAKEIEPAVLSKNKSAWTDVLKDRFARGETPTPAEKSRYNHPDIKAALLKETGSKCAYCESKLRHVTYGDIEHIVPKSSATDKWFEWGNLTLACDICNTKKGDADQLVDPYESDPEERFWIAGPIICARPGDDVAAFTELRLELNRVELVERRNERLKNLMRHLEVIQKASSDDLRALLVADFRREGEADREFAALARELIRTAEQRSAVPVVQAQ